jgi:hypothetical protein
MFRTLVWLLIFALVIIAWLVWGLYRRALVARRIGRSRRAFERQRGVLEHKFCAAAEATGKPRGLAWKKCDFHGPFILARDRANGELVGLIGVTIRFEAIEGGGMEDVAAVGNLRAATAVMQWSGHEWTTEGRAVFNLEPREVLDRYRENLELVSVEQIIV